MPYRLPETLDRRMLSLAMEAGAVGVWSWDIPTDELLWTQQVFRIHGLPADTPIEGIASFAKLVHPDDAPMVERHVRDALRQGDSYHVEFRAIRPDGAVRWLVTHGRIERDEAGQPLRLIGAVTDVTDRVALLAAERQAREDAEAARRRLELITHAGEALARSLDLRETLQAVAHALVPAVVDLCRIDLLDEQGVLQREIAYHQDPRRAQQAMELVQRLRADAHTPGSTAWVAATGKSRWGRIESSVMASDAALATYWKELGLRWFYTLPLIARGRTLGVMSVLQAESGRELGVQDRSLVQQLADRAALALDNARLFAVAQAARQQAERANRAKDEFLAILGHELRNPLAPIAAALELMARREPDAVVAQRRIIARQVNHLSRLIDDLLDVSRIAQGKIRLQEEALDLRTVVARAIELTAPVYEQRSPVQLRLPPDPVPVRGDAVRLAQVVSNLLVNAAKFTPQDGRVELEVQATGGWARLAVNDTGCGIAPQLLPHVFDLFVQGRQPLDRRAGGLGLGLAIVRNLVELHQGRVSAASEGEGRGSSFVIELPLQAQQAEPKADVSAAASASAGPDAAAGVRLLVVDDNVDAASVLADLLEVFGYQVRTAVDAESAMAQLRAFQPHLALVDIGLPTVDGYTLAGMMRGVELPHRLALVALTGYGSAQDRARALQAGFDEHLTKPVEPQQLTEVITRLSPPR